MVKVSASVFVLQQQETHLEDTITGRKIINWHDNLALNLIVNLEIYWNHNQMVKALLEYAARLDVGKRFRTMNIIQTVPNIPSRVPWMPKNIE